MMACLLFCALIDQGLPMTTVASGTLSSIDEPRQAVIRTPDEWQALWRRHGSADPPPAIDFDRQMVLAVFLGSRPTAGYRVEIVSARKTSQGLRVEYVETQPDPDKMVAQILTAPFHLVAIDRQEGAVQFVARRTP